MYNLCSMPPDILLVEDDPIVCRELAHTLRNNGYRVTEADDGAEAAELLGKQQFNLVISDLVLPKLHGFKLVELIRSRWPETPVIVISGYLSERQGSAILEGLASFIQKPVDSDILLARVRRFLPLKRVEH